jgi:hypothetical protein
VLHAPGNTPAIAGLRVVTLRADREAKVALDQVSGLFLGMGMARQSCAFAEPKLRQECLLPVNQSLSLNAVQGQLVASGVVLSEHA